MDGVSEAFYEAVCAVGRALKIKPLPNGLNTAEVGTWTLHLNTSGEPIQAPGGTSEVPPYHVLADNREYLAIATFGPSGGLIGGYTEAQFIVDMQAFEPEVAA